MAAWAMRKDDQRTEEIAVADMAQPPQGVDEADAMHADLLCLGGSQHDQPHQVVSQGGEKGISPNATKISLTPDEASGWHR
jgi:hypothetical protein